MEKKLWTVAVCELSDDKETLGKVRAIAKKYGATLDIWTDTFCDGGDSEARLYGVQDRYADRVDSELTALGLNVFDVMPENF
jgi:hypothetical protein